jgi:Tol biopolymer transport system component
MFFCVAALSLVAVHPGCGDAASGHAPARKVAQVDHAGSVSADGRYLSFAREGQYEELFVRDLVSGEDRLLAGRPGEVGAHGAPISPSGSEVAYSWSIERATEIRVVRLDGSGLRVLYREAGVSANPQDWSANGQEILVQLVNRQAQKAGLGVLTAATGSLREIKPAAMRYDPSGPFGTARFSPDERWIAFDALAAPGSATRDIFIVSADGRLEAPLVTHAGNNHLLDWTPDGRRVLFASDRAGTWDLWATPIREGKPAGPPEIVRQDVGPVLMSAGLTQDGSLHYVLNGWENDVYLTTMGTSGTVEQTVKVATKLAPDSTTQWSPDGRYLVYASGEGRQEDPLVLVVRNSDTAVESRHPLKVTGFHSFRPSWSPDGRSVLSQGRSEEYRGARSDSQGLYRVDIETGEAMPLLQTGVLCPPGCVEWGIWSPTGEAIFARWGNPQRVVARDLQSGTERELYRNAATGVEEISLLAVSSDGKWLAIAWGDYNVGERAGVKVMSTAGHDVRDLLLLPGLADYWMPLFAMAWAPDSRHLIYASTRRGDKRIELKRVSIDGGLPEDLGLALEGVWPYGMSVHPDGRRIVFSAGSPTREELWVLPEVVTAGRNARENKGPF